MVKSTRSDQFGTVESIDSTTNIDFQEKRIPPFDSGPPKTPISEVSSKIDKNYKSRRKAIKKSINRSLAIDQCKKSKKERQATSVRITSFHLSPRSLKLVQGVMRTGWYKKTLQTEGRKDKRILHPYLQS